MSQYEQENDVGRGGGEVDDDTMQKAWEDAAERRSSANVDAERDEGEDAGPQPFAKASSGEADEA